MFVELSFFKRKVRGLSWKIFNAVENNSNAKFSTNGEKVFIENLFRTFQNPERVYVLFDIGANVGEYSYMIDNKAKKNNLSIQLHLFEPTKKCFEEIYIKFSGQSKFFLNNFGVSDSEGVSKIFYDEEKSGFASLYQRNLECYNLKMDNFEEIVLKRLDRYIEYKNIQHIDFIKIDIEGHELKALEGLGSYLNGDFIDVIQFEYGGANLDSHSSLMEIYKFLREKGFAIGKVLPSGLDIRNYAPFMENFQYSNYVAVSKKVI